MHLANRPSFYVILLLIASLVVLTAYLMWKLPVAEELSRAKKNPAPAPLPISRP